MRHGEITFTTLPPPATPSEEYYRKGWLFADDALIRYGNDTCMQMRKRMVIDSSYERGAADRFDGKPHKYGK